MALFTVDLGRLGAAAVFPLRLFLGFSVTASAATGSSFSFSLSFLRLMAIDFPSLLIHAAQLAGDCVVCTHLFEREPELLLPTPLRDSRNVLRLALQPQVLEVDEYDLGRACTEELQQRFQQALRISIRVLKQASRLQKPGNG